MSDSQSQFVSATRRAFMIPGMIWPREMNSLETLLGTSTRHVEVGTFCGKSLYVTAAAMAANRSRSGRKLIVAVDNFSECLNDGSQFVPSTIWWKQVLDATIAAITKEFDIEIQLIDGASSDAAAKLVAETQFDSIYVDANHSQEYVAQDILCWWPLLRGGGIMCGHDYSAECLGTMNAVNEAFGKNFNVVPDTRIWYAVKSHETEKSIIDFQSCN